MTLLKIQEHASVEKKTMRLQLAPVAALCILILNIYWDDKITTPSLFVVRVLYYKYTGDIVSQFQSKIEADRMNDSAILLQLSWFMKKYKIR